MVMDGLEEYRHLSKKTKQDTDYFLCLKCQCHTNDQLVKNPKVDSIEKFMNDVKRRAGFGDPEFIPIYERLSQLNPDILKEKNIIWHRKCYANTTNSDHIRRAEERHKKALFLEDTTVLKRKKGRPATSLSSTSNTQLDQESSQCIFTRSQKSPFNKSECFFCQETKQDKLHVCRSHNVGIRISDIVKSSGNTSWKVNYADLISQEDALSRDILYHKSCMTEQWQKFKSSKNSQSTPDQEEHLEYTIKFVAAEIQFYSQLKERLHGGEILSIESVHDDYHNIMREHNLSHRIERSVLKESIIKHIHDVEFGRPQNRRKSSLIHTTKARDAAVDEASKHSQSEKINIIFECAKIIRAAIGQCKQWTFQGTLPEVHDGTPDELGLLIKWIIVGHGAVQSDSRMENINKTANHLSQQIIQATKSQRQTTYKPKSLSKFRNRTETPLTVGISLHCYHNTRSKKMLDMLAHAGSGITYSQTSEHVNQIACTVQKNTLENGFYIPPKLLKNQPFVAAIDNIDARVDTPDGKNSFHALSASLFQRTSEPDKENVYVVDRLKLNSKEKGSISLKDVPKTAVELETCTLIGNPKPPGSPHFPNFIPFSHELPTQIAHKNDMVWLIARYYNRCMLTGTAELEHDIDNSTESPLKQNVSVWAAYNSQLMSNKTQSVHKAHALPLINAPPHEWTTLVTSLVHLHNINVASTSSEDQLPVCVWLDMNLYKRVRKIPFLQPDIYQGLWIESPGQFHISLCALRCLGNIVEGSGLDTALTEANIYSNVTIMQILNGKHYKRAVECHLVLMETLHELWLDAFFEAHPNVLNTLEDTIKELITACQTGIRKEVASAHSQMITNLDSLDLESLVESFDASNAQNPMYKWARMYMRQVSTFLQFLRSTRQQDWHLHLASLEQLCISFFAFNRLDYAMHIPEYLARMYDLEQSNPQVWHYFEMGGFTVSSSQVPFTSIGVDHAQEHVNKVHKGDGGISGITTNPETLLRYCLSGPELIRLAQETEEMLGITAPMKKVHHDMCDTKVQRQEKNIKKLKDVISNNNPFKKPNNQAGTESNLIHVTNNMIIPEKVTENILDTENRGRMAYLKFVQERISGSGNLWDKMNKVKVLGWNEAGKPIKTKIGSEQVILRQSSSLLARLLVITRSSRDIDLKEVIGTYELTSVNNMLMNADGTLHPCTDKSQLLHELLAQVNVDDDYTSDNNDENAFNFENVSLVLDGMVIVNELVVFRSAIKTCEDLAKYFVQAIDNKSRKYESTCLVFDNYKVQFSMKEQTRKRRTGGKASIVTAYKVDDSTPIHDFTGFLSSTHTKDLLTLYLSQKLMSHSSSKVMVVNRTGVYSNSCDATMNIESTQEEVDTLIILFAAEIHRTGKTVHIYSSDTDILVLALSNLEHIGLETTMIMGTGVNRKWVPLQPIYHALGHSRVTALNGLHALSGCDTTGRLFGKSKSSWWKTFINVPEQVLTSLSNLGIGDQPTEQVLSGCELFICRLFNSKTDTFSDAKQLRWHHFRNLKPNQGVEKLPPTQGAMHEHIKRAHLQCKIWRQTLIPDPTIPDPIVLGWYRGTSDNLLPLLTKLPIAPDSLLQLVKCTCTTSRCLRRCSCREHDIPCTELCGCHGETDRCKNIPVVVEDSSDSDQD